MAFDITSVLRNVSDSDTGREQIEYISIDRLDPDPKNFYSLDGICELADNIATIGLQQPIRVRPADESGRYTVVSGHRRRAAILLLQDGEDDAAHMFDGGVPCIVDRGEASDALRELRLIYANSATRVMGAAEISRQAERVEMLLYQLKDEGVEFPGRMRDHVAEACRISKTKLARLHAIRNNLDPVFLEYFDRGELPEETAYQLQRLPAEVRHEAANQLASGKRKKLPLAIVVGEVNRSLEDYQKELPCRAHAGGPDCHWKTEKIVKSLFAPYSWQVCEPGKCCRDCYHNDNCSGCCPEQKARQKLNKAVEKEKQDEQKKAEDARQRMFRRTLCKTAKRLLPALDASGLPDEYTFPGKHAYHRIQISTIRSWAADDFGDAHFYDSELLPTRTDLLMQWADELHCTTDYLLGRTDSMQPAVSDSDTGLKWQTGTPTEPGIYETRISLTNEDTPQVGHWQRLEWSDGVWGFPNTHAPLPKGQNVIRWVRLPEV